MEHGRIEQTVEVATHPLRWSARSGSTSHSGLHSTKTIARDIEPSRNNGASK